MTSSSTPQTCTAPLKGCLEAIDRCKALLDELKAKRDSTASEDFCKFGPHLRHCLDHFTALKRGLESGKINYDDRDRSPAVETDLKACQAEIASIRQWLQTLSTRPDQEVEVTQLACSGKHLHSMRSTLERELVFLSSHTIHHLAVVDWICKTKGFELPESITLAFSTKAYREPVES